MLATILTILGTLVPTILNNAGVIGTKTTTLITNLLGPVSTLISNLMAGQSKTQDGLAVLGAMAGVVATLKADTNLSPAVLTQIGNIDSDIQAALVAYVNAEKGLDLSIYAQIAPVA